MVCSFQNCPNVQFTNLFSKKKFNFHNFQLCDIFFHSFYFHNFYFYNFNFHQEVVVDEAKEEILNENEKLMMFTTGSRSYQPHQIGIKLMSKVKFRTKLNIPENIYEAAEESRRKREEERASRLDRINFEPTPWSDYRQVAQMFDVIDVLIDFHGFVTGYGVSPDSRFSTLPPKMRIRKCS